MNEHDFKIQPRAILRHFKGGVYQVVAVATVEATGDKVVVYQSHENGRYWTRPVLNFVESVSIGEARIDRFSRVRCPSCRDVTMLAMVPPGGVISCFACDAVLSPEELEAAP